MSRKLRRWRIVLGAGVGALLVVGLVLTLGFGRPGPSLALPDPNGYDDLVGAGRSVTGTKADPVDLTPGGNSRAGDY